MKYLILFSLLLIGQMALAAGPFDQVLEPKPLAENCICYDTCNIDEEPWCSAMPRDERFQCFCDPAPDPITNDCTLYDTCNNSEEPWCGELPPEVRYQCVPIPDTEDQVPRSSFSSRH